MQVCNNLLALQALPASVFAFQLPALIEQILMNYQTQSISKPKVS
jgi:hypothetical protein